MEIEIEKGIPVPTGTGNLKYPFSTMEVGDSVLFSDIAAGKKAYNSARKFNLRSEKRFVQRKTEEGVRIWRAE